MATATVLVEYETSDDATSYSTPSVTWGASVAGLIFYACRQGSGNPSAVTPTGGWSTWTEVASGASGTVAGWGLYLGTGTKTNQAVTVNYGATKLSFFACVLGLTDTPSSGTIVRAGTNAAGSGTTATTTAPASLTSSSLLVSFAMGNAGTAATHEGTWTELSDAGITTVTPVINGNVSSRPVVDGDTSTTHGWGSSTGWGGVMVEVLHSAGAAVDADGTQTGTATLAGAADLNRGAAGTTSATATLAGAAAVSREAAGTVAATATHAGAATVNRSASGTRSVTATIVGSTGAASQSADGTLAATATIAGSAEVTSPVVDDTIEPFPVVAATSEEIRTLVEAADIEVDAFCVLVDSSDSDVEDISVDLERLVVQRQMFADIHSTCQVRIRRELLWASQRVRVGVTLTSWSELLTYSWTLGVFLLDTPQRNVGEYPQTWDVEGYDKLVLLHGSAGVTWQAPAGASVLEEVSRALAAAGIPANRVRLDTTAAAKTIASDKVWPLDESTRWLGIVNDLLSLVGYQGLWVDRDGTFRSEPYRLPTDRPVMWNYSTTSKTTTVGEDRVVAADFFDAPNRWVFIRDDPSLGVLEEGAGIYTVENQSDGATSIASRGRRITRVARLDAADQDSLVSQGNRMVENDKRVDVHVGMTVGINPEHFHFDVVSLEDPDGALSGRFSVQSWTINPDEDMTLELKAVAA